MAKLDLTGKKYGHLTVISESEEPYISPKGVSYRRWNCVCDCGNEIAVRQGHLTSGVTTNCGCMRKSKAYDLTGKRFGRLTAVQREVNQKGETYWRCQCDCGKECVVRTKLLMNGKTRSCGCFSSEVATKKSEIDNVFERYDGTAISSMRKKLAKNNTSGVTGVNWKTKDKRWVASIKVRGKSIHLGTFHDFDEAVEARRAGEEEYFKPIIEEYNAIKQKELEESQRS